jgi:2-polyprenyl-3-methyl-5-hydroxy-6-metoxy-1,4-benzoquinol methylase
MLSTTNENQALYAPADKAPGFDADRSKLLSRWLRGISQANTSLDVGCSSGGFSSLLPDTVEKWGIDFEHHPALAQDFKFQSGDFSQPWAVPTDYFDLLLAGEVIEHVLDTDLFLQRCFESLRSGGHVLLTTPNLASFANLRYWLQTDQYMWVDSGANQMGHVRYLAPKRMEQALYRSGFESVKIQSVAGLEGLDIFPPLRQLMQKIFPLRGNRLCAIARKP